MSMPYSDPLDVLLAEGVGSETGEHFVIRRPEKRGDQAVPAGTDVQCRQFGRYNAVEFRVTWT